MKRRYGLLVFAAVVTAFVLPARPAGAACINSLTGTVDNIADCLEASKKPEDCRLVFAVDFDGSGSPPPDPKKIECVDGAACDADGVVNGSCTFHVGACVNAGVGCPAITASGYETKKPSSKDGENAIKKPQAVYIRRTVGDAVAALLPSAVETCTAADLPVVVAIKPGKGTCNSPAGAKCENDQECDDYCVPSFKKKGKEIVGLDLLDDQDKKADSDKLKLTCLSPENGLLGSEAFKITDSADLIGGPLAMGEVGDYMIRNGQIRAVIRDVGRLHSFMLLNGGQIIDADLVRDDPAEDRDNWLGIQPLVHISATQATTNVDVINDGTNGLPAHIRSSGPDDLFDVIKPDVMVWSSPGISVPPDATDQDLPLNLKTDFILTADRNYIQMATTFENLDATDLDLYVGDFINAGGTVEPFGPGLGFGEPLLRNGGSAGSGGNTLDFVAYKGSGDAAGLTYGIVFPQTVAGATRNTSMFSQDGVQVWAHNQDLFSLLFGPYNGKDPGSFSVPGSGENTLRRWFVVGKTIADVAKARIDLFGKDYGAIQGTVTVDGVPVEGASVVIMNQYVNYGTTLNCSGVTTECTGVVSSTTTDSAGFYRVYVPASSKSYRIAVRAPGVPYEGDSSVPAETSFIMKKKKTVVHDVDLPRTATLTVNVQDQSGSPIAGKVSIVGVPEAPDPLNSEFVLLGVAFEGRLFGVPYENKVDTFGLVDTLFADTSGSTGTVKLEPGSYTLVVSHGPEYDADKIDITLAAGDDLVETATVNRVVDTSGFVSMDNHVHMLNSPDSAVPREKRILTMLAEGLDFFSNSDHDFAHSLNDEISAMGVGSDIMVAPGAEVTTSHYGHYNIWPLTLDPGSRIGGPADWGRPQLVANNGLGYPSNGSYDLLPAEIYATANPATQVVQINHFNSSSLGFFSMLGIDTFASPPTSSNQVYRCVGGDREGAVCEAKICIGGGNDGAACTSAANCPGGACYTPAGFYRGCNTGTCTLTGNNLSSYLRLDPSVGNLYDDDFTALEVWIEANRSQTETFLGDNLGDWFALLNQGRFKTGTADSDTHQTVAVQGGGPRTYVASPTDDPASIDPAVLAVNTNAGRVMGSGGLFVKTTITGAAAATATHALGSPLTVQAAGGGSDALDIHVESPTWAEFDTVDVYLNTVPDCVSEWTFFGVINPSSCTVTPDATLIEGVDFTRNTAVGVSGFGTRYTADIHLPLTITEDTWVVVVARGTDGVSAPLFPMNPQDLDDAANATLADLTDNDGPLPWNLGEDGQTALGFTNPLFFDFEGDGFCNGGTACP